MTQQQIEMDSDQGEYFDVIVIGAGIMGSCAAYQMAKSGLKTLLLEQFSFLHHLGSSHGDSRTLRLTYPEPFYPPMVAQSILLWREAESEIGYRVYTPTPHLDMGPRDNPSLQSLLSVCRQNCIDHRVLKPSDFSDEFGGAFRVPDDWMGVVTRDGGFIRATKAVAMFQTLAIRHHAVLRDHHRVVSVDRLGPESVAVSTESGERFACKKCVLTVGAWTEKVTKRVGAGNVPVKPLQTVICYWKIKEQCVRNFLPENGFPTFACYDDPYIYGTSGADFPGLIKIGVHGGCPCDPDRRDWTMDLDSFRQKASPWIRDCFGEAVLSNQPLLSQGCMYSMTPDEDFVIDFAGGELGKDVVIAGGFSGHGFKMGPLVGRVVAEMVIQGEALALNLDHFRLGRFRDNPQGNVKDFTHQVSFFPTTLSGTEI